MNKRKSKNLSDRTIDRNRNDWDKYYQTSAISRKAIDRITTEDIENFFHACITHYDMTKKCLNNMKMIFKDLMKMAKKKGYIITNPFDDIEVNVGGCKPPNNPKDESRVLSF